MEYLIFFIIFLINLINCEIYGVDAHFFGDEECRYERHHSFYINGTTVPSWMVSGQMGFNEYFVVHDLSNIEGELGGVEKKQYQVGKCYKYTNKTELKMSFMLTGIELTKPDIQFYRYFFNNDKCEGIENIMAVAIRGLCVECMDSYRKGCTDKDPNQMYELHYKTSDCSDYIVKMDLFPKKCDDVNWSIDVCNNLLTKN